MTQGKPYVLLVDDIEANLIALEAQLATLDCQLVRATSGNDALRQLLKRPFAVMLLDVQMPDMDGYEVARYARQNPTTRDLPIIFVTAMLETQDRVLRGYGSGAVDFLFKPVSPYVLRSKVQVFLDLHVGRHQLATEIEAHKHTLAELEAFNYSVSHDLRAPLRALDGFSQVLLEDYAGALDDKGRDYLGRIRAGAQRMSQLIDDLLRLSRIGRSPIKTQPIDLSSLCGAITGELTRAEPARAVEIVIEDDLAADGDPGLLRIVLENLLRNAWKFTGKKERARIEIGQKSGPGERPYFVRDDGVGFDPASAGRLFQPFQRLHPASQFEGTGIGLAIVQRIVRQHGGRVWVEAAPDGGATFFFTLAGAEAAPESQIG